VPRDAVGDEGIGTIVVRGAGEAITQIELRPKPGLRIEIAIQETEAGVEFSAEELERHFR
jgi:hypothetical protein